MILFVYRSKNCNSSIFITFTYYEKEKEVVSNSEGESE